MNFFRALCVGQPVHLLGFTERWLGQELALTDVCSHKFCFCWTSHFIGGECLGDISFNPRLLEAKEGRLPVSTSAFHGLPFAYSQLCPVSLRLESF